jgi:hypothetical protein
MATPQQGTASTPQYGPLSLPPLPMGNVAPASTDWVPQCSGLKTIGNLLRVHVNTDRAGTAGDAGWNTCSRRRRGDLFLGRTCYLVPRLVSHTPPLALPCPRWPFGALRLGDPGAEHDAAELLATGPQCWCRTQS